MNNNYDFNKSKCGCYLRKISWHCYKTLFKWYITLGILKLVLKHRYLKKSKNKNFNNCIIGVNNGDEHACLIPLSYILIYVYDIPFFIILYRYLYYNQLVDNFHVINIIFLFYRSGISVILFWGNRNNLTTRPIFT